MTLEQFIEAATPYCGDLTDGERFLVIRCPRVLQKWCSNRHRDATWPLWGLAQLGEERRWDLKYSARDDNSSWSSGYVCRNDVAFFFSHSEQREDSLYSYLNRIWVPRHLLPLPNPAKIYVKKGTE